MTFATYLSLAIGLLIGAVLTPNQGQALGLGLLAVLTLVAAVVQGDILK